MMLGYGMNYLSRGIYATGIGECAQSSLSFVVSSCVSRSVLISSSPFLSHVHQGDSKINSSQDFFSSIMVFTDHNINVKC